MKELKFITKSIIFITLAAGAFIVGGCGSSSTSYSGNDAPVADGGIDRDVATGSTVTLDGSSSSDSDGYIATYHWELNSKPAGSLATLSDETLVSPTFTTDLDGAYVLELTVNDGLVNSAVDTVTITAVNTPPMADAGPGQTISNRTLVTLDGGASSDANGDDLTYLWSFAAVPDGSGTTGASLSDAASATPTFTPDVVGDYVLSLIVNDGAADSTAGTVTITATNNVPVADAGDDRHVLTDNPVLLDGNGSSDADDDTLIYLWTFTVDPGGAATLSNAATSTPTFTASAGGVYELGLIVTDTAGASSLQDMVIITAGTIVAEAGFDQTVATGSTAHLNGSGLGTGTLNYLWTFDAVPGESDVTDISLSGAKTAMPTFTTDVDGEYILSLVITDDVGRTSEPDTVTITASVPLASLTFTDINLKNCVVASAAYVSELTDLYCSGKYIADLGGIENLTSLTTLYLNHNDIIDIAPLAGLTGLTQLYLGTNSITNVSALASLTNLKELHLYGNQISDISSLTGLNKLTELFLSNNKLTTVPDLSGLTSLTKLYLGGISNNISDISGLAGMSANLTDLDLSFNSISDIAPLANLTGLTTLRLYDNEIITVPNLSGLTNLTYLSMGSNQIEDVSGLADMTNLATLYLDSNNITDSDLATLSGLTGLTKLRLDYNSITDQSSLSGLTNLAELDLDFTGMSDVTSLSGLTSLTKLELSSNSISDISQLSNLTGLTTLYLSGNNIGDIAALASMTNLTTLYLGGNNINDITPLTDLTGLVDLSLAGNSITNITPLGGMSGLVRLYLVANTISDVTILGNLTSLVYVYLDNNLITTGVADLQTLTSAQTITLTGNDSIPCTDLDTLKNALPGAVITGSCI